MFCLKNVFICIALASTYVGSLYVWSNNLSRDHPSTIKKRFISIFFMTILSSIVVYLCVDSTYFKDYSYLSLIGLRFDGLLAATVIPLILTMILFSGPLCLRYLERIYQKSFDIRLWKHYITNLVWLRNLVVAPFSEEFTFRACMFPILFPCLGAFSVFICPLFFGVAHLHHLREKLFREANVKMAVMQSLFELSYTTLFGAYSSYLFYRTGHFVSPFIVHSFCNYMGFPDFEQVLNYGQPKKSILMIIFTCGLICWMLLLAPLTNPTLYGNKIYL